MSARQHKLAALTWAVVYPLITVLLAVLEPLLDGVPMPLRTLMLSAIMVPAMVYVAMPWMSRRFAGWLGGDQEVEEMDRERRRRPMVSESPTRRPLGSRERPFSCVTKNFCV